jgi:hypothetical protein
VGPVDHRGKTGQAYRWSAKEDADRKDWQEYAFHRGGLSGCRFRYGRFRTRNTVRVTVFPALHSGSEDSSFFHYVQNSDHARGLIQIFGSRLQQKREQMFESRKPLGTNMLLVVRPGCKRLST